jgi:hypothetical protein
MYYVHVFNNNRMGHDPWYFSGHISRGGHNPADRIGALVTTGYIESWFQTLVVLASVSSSTDQYLDKRCSRQLMIGTCHYLDKMCRHNDRLDEVRSADR